MRKKKAGEAPPTAFDSSAGSVFN